METFYFPLFLIVAAIVVVLVFKRAGARKSSRRTPVARTPAGRTADAHLLRRDTDHFGRASKPAGGSSKRMDMWQTRRERAAKDSFVETTARRGTHYAGYIGPYSEGRRSNAYGQAGYELKDQNITKAEHLGIDEYLTKREREEREKAEKQAREAGGLSMTAMKYEPSDAPSKGGKERKKQAGFKP